MQEQKKDRILRLILLPANTQNRILTYYIRTIAFQILFTPHLFIFTPFFLIIEQFMTRDNLFFFLYPGAILKKKKEITIMNQDILTKLESLFDDLAYEYGEELETLEDDEDREEQFAQLEANKTEFHALMSQLTNETA